MTSGTVYTDSVNVAGITARNQGVGYATSVSSTTGATFDGLVGMAYSSIATTNTNTFFTTLINQGAVNSPVFSFALSQSGAELYLGGTDSAKYSGSITYTPVTQQAYWTVTQNAATVNGKQVVGSRGSVIDTGTTLIYTNAADAQAFYGGFGSAKPLSSFGYSGMDGYYAIPCNGNTAISLCESSCRRSSRTSNLERYLTSNLSSPSSNSLRRPSILHPLLHLHSTRLRRILRWYPILRRIPCWIRRVGYG